MQIVKLLVDKIPRSDHNIQQTYQYDTYPALNATDHKFKHHINDNWSTSNHISKIMLDYT